MNPYYLTGNKHLTLLKALDGHYEINPQFTHWDKFKSPIGQKLVKAHDIMHVLFGCDTSLLGEMRVQIWTKNASPKFTLKQKIQFLTDKESRVLLMNPIGYRGMLLFFIKNLQELRKVKINAKMLNKKWVYFNAEEYESKTIEEIRGEFGIVVV